MMATLAGSLRHQSPRWHQSAWRRWNPRVCTRALTTGALSTELSASHSNAEPDSVMQSVQLPFQGVTHARTVPATPSYFSREPRFNDLYVGISNVLAKYRHLPTLAPNEAPQVSWVKLEEMRLRLAESIKASHFATVMRVAKRLSFIEPTIVPAEVTVALREFIRDVNPKFDGASPVAIDKFGRAIAVGKRKESTSRAFVVEGTGEILVNGKPLNQVFGRVHDRESAAWALIATGRLDKYNVWALVEGGGTTGQAEALALAVAKALVAHEPALKVTLRRAGCITRDPRAVERKKHGHVKARKMPAWVKR